MVEEEEQKPKIFNTVHMNHPSGTPKKKYFRIEKDKRYSLNEAHSKAIFRTKKDYNFLRRKTLREIEIPKINKSNNKFITTTIEDTTASAQSESSNLVKKIIPRKLTLIKENKKIKNGFSEFNQEPYSLLRTLFRPEINENFQENKKNKQLNENFCGGNLGLGAPSAFQGHGNLINDKLEKCRIKFMLVYFNSIKNLCKYINKNFFDIEDKENTMVDAFLNQVYQTFRILNRKINEFKIFQYMKDIFKSKIKEEDFVDIISLKQNLEFMKNVLNKKMSENLIIIYINIENFCKVFSPIIE